MSLEVDSSARTPQNDTITNLTDSTLLEGGRDIRTVTAEIRTLQAQTQRLVLEYAIEIGRRLHEAKEMLPHGEWGTWLRDEVSFSQSTANNLMRIFDEYGADQITLFGAVAKSQALGNLSYTKALRLLALPADERESFVEENDVEGMSTRELEQAIREKQSAEKELELAIRARAAAEEEVEAQKQATASAENRAAKAEQELADETARLEGERADLERIKNEQIELREKLEKAKAAEKAAKDKLAELKKNPQVAPEVLEKLRAEAAEAAKTAADLDVQQKTAALEAKTREAEEQARAAAARAAQAEADAETMRKALAVASPETAVFKDRFERAQATLNELLRSWEQVRDKDAGQGEKLGRAILALVESVGKRVG